MLVCDQITTNEQWKGHVLGRVLNQLTIPVLPFAQDLHILLKIFDIPVDKSVDTYFVFSNSRGEQIVRTEMAVLRNYREADQVPGVDKNFVATLVLTETGVIHIRCFVDDEEQAWYPLTIRLQEED